MSVKTSTTETPRNSSFCSSPICEYCEFNLSQVDSASTSPWMMLSKSPVEPSAREVFAMMEAADAVEPPADNESSSRVTGMMNAARTPADFVSGASASRTKNQAPLPLTPEQLDFDKRVEAATAKFSSLIAEAKAQLAAPKIAPEELTEEEEEEARRNRERDLQHQQKNQAIDEATERKQALFENLTDTVDDMEAKGIPIPDYGDLDFNWKSNAGFAGTSSNAGRLLAPLAASSMANRSQTASHQDRTRTVTTNPAAAGSQAKGKSEAKAQDQPQVWKNVFKREFGFSW